MRNRAMGLPGMALALLLAMTPGAVAAEDAPTAGEAPAEAPAGDPRGGATDPEAGASDDAPADAASAPAEGDAEAGVFVPTEEISEDFAVPFPVDI